MNGGDPLDLEQIESILKKKLTIEHNPFATMSRQSIREALKIIEEYSEELTTDS